MVVAAARSASASAAASTADRGHGQSRKKKASATRKRQQHSSKPPQTRRHGKAQAQQHAHQTHHTTKPAPTTAWSFDRHSLATNRLALADLMPIIGFPRSKSFVKHVDNIVRSKYGQGLFDTIVDDNGHEHNIAVDHRRLEKFAARLARRTKVLTRRRDWLQSESRLVFGPGMQPLTLRANNESTDSNGDEDGNPAAESNVVILMLHVSDATLQSKPWRDLLGKFLCNRFTGEHAFNIFRTGPLESHACFEHPEPATVETMQRAVAWLAALPTNTSAGDVLDCLNTVHIAHPNATLHMVVEGVITAPSLVQSLCESFRTRVSVSAINTGPGSDAVLQAIATATGGRFHSYTGDVSSPFFDGTPASPELTQLLAEIAEARRIQGLIEAIMVEEEYKRRHAADMMHAQSATAQKGQQSPAKKEQEEADWLALHNLKAQKLDFYSAVKPATFKHVQDDINILEYTGNDDAFGDTAPATAKAVMVHAHSCRNIPRIRWKNGKDAHVFITDTMMRNYEEKVRAALTQYQRHLARYERSSVSAFGVCEHERIAIAVDMSDSMAQHTRDVARLIAAFLREQAVPFKREFTLIAYGDAVVPWTDAPVTATKEAAADAVEWLRAVRTLGSTNTLAALQHVAQVPDLNAVYIVSDGLPNQPTSEVEIFAERLHEDKGVVVNTVSFNCRNRRANDHLHALASATQGTFQYHLATPYDANTLTPELLSDAVGPPPLGGLDVAQSLRREIIAAHRALHRFTQLYHECQAAMLGVDAATLASDVNKQVNGLRNGTNAANATRDSTAKGKGNTSVHGSDRDSGSVHEPILLPAPEIAQRTTSVRGCAREQRTPSPVRVAERVWDTRSVNSVARARVFDADLAAEKEEEEAEEEEEARQRENDRSFAESASPNHSSSSSGGGSGRKKRAAGGRRRTRSSNRGDDGDSSDGHIEEYSEDDADESSASSDDDDESVASSEDASTATSMASTATGTGTGGSAGESDHVTNTNDKKGGKHRSSAGGDSSHRHHHQDGSRGDATTSRRASNTRDERKRNPSQGGSARENATAKTAPSSSSLSSKHTPSQSRHQAHGKGTRKTARSTRAPRSTPMRSSSNNSGANNGSTSNRHKGKQTPSPAKSKQDPYQYMRDMRLPKKTDLSQPTRLWLESYSLESLKLTLLQVLQPTVVKHCSEYVHSIGRTVHAKALSDVFNFYKVEADGEVLFVNPAAANLNLYLDRLDAVEQVYCKRFLAHARTRMTTTQRLRMARVAPAARMEVASTLLDEWSQAMQSSDEHGDGSKNGGGDGAHANAAMGDGSNGSGTAVDDKRKSSVPALQLSSFSSTPANNKSTADEDGDSDESRTVRGMLLLRQELDRVHDNRRRTYALLKDMAANKKDASRAEAQTLPMRSSLFDMLENAGVTVDPSIRRSARDTTANGEDIHSHDHDDNLDAVGDGGGRGGPSDRHRRHRAAGGARGASARARPRSAGFLQRKEQASRTRVTRRAHTRAGGRSGARGAGSSGAVLDDVDDGGVRNGHAVQATPTRRKGDSISKNTAKKNSTNTQKSTTNTKRSTKFNNNSNSSNNKARRPRTTTAVTPKSTSTPPVNASAHRHVRIPRYLRAGDVQRMKRSGRAGSGRHCSGAGNRDHDLRRGGDRARGDDGDGEEEGRRTRGWSLRDDLATALHSSESWDEDGDVFQHIGEDDDMYDDGDLGYNRGAVTDHDDHDDDDDDDDGDDGGGGVMRPISTHHRQRRAQQLSRPGTHVLAVDAQSGRLFAAKTAGTTTAGDIALHFDDEEQEELDGLDASPTIVPVHDVYLRWTNCPVAVRRGNESAWLPGTVSDTTTSPDGAAFTVIAINGVQVHRARDEIVKISRRQHDRLLAQHQSTLDQHIHKLRSQLQTIELLESSAAKTGRRQKTTRAGTRAGRGRDGEDVCAVDREQPAWREESWAEANASESLSSDDDGRDDDDDDDDDGGGDDGLGGDVDERSTRPGRSHQARGSVGKTASTQTLQSDVGPGTPPGTVPQTPLHHHRLDTASSPGAMTASFLGHSPGLQQTLDWDVHDLGASLYGEQPSPALTPQQQQHQHQGVLSAVPANIFVTEPATPGPASTNRSDSSLATPSPSVTMSTPTNLLSIPHTGNAALAYTPSPGDTNQSLTFGVAVEMAIERTLAIVFPRTFAAGGADMAINQDAREFFWEYRSQHGVYDALVEALSEGPCHVAVLSGPGVIASWRRMIGADVNGNSVNAPLLHGSQSVLHAEREIAFFFDPKQRTVVVSDHDRDAQACTRALDLVGQAVLARWHEDGWFYITLLRDYLGGGVYCVEDDHMLVESVADNTLISLDDCERPRAAGAKVLAEHPLFDESFCPGEVQVDKDGDLAVVFYDNTGIPLCDVTAYTLPDQGLYESLCAFCNERDNAWVGMRVVCRYDEDNLYYEGTVLSRLSRSGRWFKISLDDGHVVRAQEPRHMLAHSRDGEGEHVLRAGDHAIALHYHGEPGDPYEHSIFGPAKVLASTLHAITVRFWDGKKCQLRRSQCYFVSKQYYQAACEALDE
ncbi:hypothetical protein PTSG_11678 [Salpingoeca rosetta]|uniref:VWFA domain-containing protein n=1 Tax=Salpingoeca rosetta (strain ATCC 50818 / BSB-021) TaxID=946362 RepID=F2TY91_SALR5|nr:uncharacterized protein PTSG_11678 [Salpingoeca rosetta]EGD76350.1 hypothetical protein PTSG_11678 [Salpingoeca rosetta]|eukprot:XP_004998525.1 hypothetical protein PTSG_11678 [Salpingoeca rosetta]